MSPTIAVPVAVASTIASSIACVIWRSRGSGCCRRAAITPRIQVTNSDAGGTPSRRYASSRCDVAVAEDRITEDFVVHVPPLRDEAGVLDVAHDLDFVHAVARAGGADDILLDHHTAHVVGAVREAQLSHLAALRDPRSLEVVEVV